MTLPIQSFQQLVDNQSAAVLAQSTNLYDFREGSVLRALIESNAGNSIWIQGLISSLLAVARLQTSSGNDVDTFIEQFGYARTPAVASSGTVTFGRTITSSISYIPASSTIVQTSSNNVQFVTIIDTTNPNYDATTNSYLMNTTVSSINVPVQCLTAGSIGNVGASAINTIVTPIVNVTSVTNSSAFTNGSDIASDQQAKIGFVNYLEGLSKATNAAVAFAVSNVPGVTRYAIFENVNESGATQLGYFYVIIDNGSGTTPTNVKTNVQNAVNAVRGLAIVANVDTATSNLCSGLTATLKVPTGTTTAQEAVITSTIQTNVASFLSTLGLGTPNNTFYFTRVIQLLYDASDLILDVSSVTLNGSSSADFTSSNLQVPTIAANTIVMTYVN